MHIVLDITKLVEEGKLTPEQAEHLKKLAARDTGSLAINVLLSVGVIALAVGILALHPSAVTAITLGAALAASGLLIKLYRQEPWGLVGSASVLVGALVASGGIVLFWQGNVAAFLLVGFIFVALGVPVRNGLLIGLVPLALAAAVGSSTGYWHASYMLVVREASVTIVVFALLAWGAYHASKRLASAYERLAVIFSRVSLILVNLGFWVGSLWGDYPGESWIRPDVYARIESLRQGPHGAFFIPDIVFAASWAIGLVAVGAWGATRNRRFVVNTAAVFGSIHFYTQWFERLGATPETMIGGGLAAVGAAIGLWQYNRLAAERLGSA